jgi:chorismate mutase
MSEPEGWSQELLRIRALIESLDRELVGLVAERVRLAREVGRLKRLGGVPTLDPAREAAVIRRSAALAREAGLEEEDVRQIFWHLVGLSRRAQLEDPNGPGAR